MSVKEDNFPLTAISFFFSTLFFLSFKMSISIISNFCEKDLGSKSKVSVSPIKLNLLSNIITLSKF